MQNMQFIDFDNLQGYVPVHSVCPPFLFIRCGMHMKCYLNPPSSSQVDSISEVLSSIDGILAQLFFDSQDLIELGQTL